MQVLRQHFKCLIIILFPSETFLLRDICLDKKLMSQESGENVYQFVCRLHQQAVTCEFGIKCYLSHLHQKFMEKEGTITLFWWFVMGCKIPRSRWSTTEAWRTLLVYMAKNLTSFGSYELISRACLSRARLLKCSRFFFRRWDLVCRPRVPSEDRGNWG